MSLETMTKITSFTVGAGGTSTVTFSNIPQTYTDLKLVVSSRQNLAQNYGVLQLYFNNDATNLTYRILTGTNGTAASAGQSNTNGIYGVYSDNGANSTANTFSNMEFYMCTYTSNMYKTVSYDEVSEGNGAYPYAILGAGVYANTSPITSLTLTTGGSGANFVQHSTYTLYGVKALRTAIGPSLKATGGAISFDGTYYYHTFSSSEILDVKQPLTNVDFLVVAGGGGGGGGSSGGGGGAGGFRTSAGTSGRGASAESKLTLAPGSYPVVVGGGAAQSANGTNSSFSTIVSLGGGGNGVNGGSGGGQSSGGGPAGNYARGLGTTGQGYDGGAHTQTTYYPAGGGGGAGANGANATSAPTSGNGGIGVASSITGVSTYYAGGGGGGGQFSGTAGTGGLGGGAAGSITVNGGNGSGGTGGGGGGAGFDGTGRSGGSGGSGIVVIRYAK